VQIGAISGKDGNYMAQIDILQVKKIPLFVQRIGSQ
jgi:hypothetical protein